VSRVVQAIERSALARRDHHYRRRSSRRCWLVVLREAVVPRRGLADSRQSKPKWFASAASSRAARWVLNLAGLHVDLRYSQRHSLISLVLRLVISAGDLVVHTGAWDGELLALTRPDVDMAERMLAIRRTLTWARTRAEKASKPSMTPAGCWMMRGG
jgi:hypothetical protein